MNAEAKPTIAAVLIDPVEMTVTDTTIRQDNIEDIYERIGVRCFDISRYRAGKQDLSFFVDDEGLLTDSRSYFVFCPLGRDPNAGGQLAGKGLVLGGADEEGRTLPCPFDAEHLRPLIVFIVHPEGHGPAYAAAGVIATLRRYGQPVPPAWIDTEDRVNHWHVEPL